MHKFYAKIRITLILQNKYFQVNQSNGKSLSLWKLRIRDVSTEIFSLLKIIRNIFFCFNITLFPLFTFTSRSKFVFSLIKIYLYSCFKIHFQFYFRNFIQNIKLPDSPFQNSLFLFQFFSRLWAALLQPGEFLIDTLLQNFRIKLQKLKAQGHFSKFIRNNTFKI